MAVFRHPHLIRGIVHTPHGAFKIDRGLANLPDDIGEALGWPRLDDEHTQPVSVGRNGNGERRGLTSVDAN